MSPLKMKQEEKTSFLKKTVLPAYIILSLLFIGYTGYMYFKTVVYKSWVMAGQNVWVSAGQEQGYKAAVQDLIKQVSEKCEPVAINLGETQVDVINVSCLQQEKIEE